MKVLVVYNNKMPFVFKCSWFESERHRKSHTSICFEREEDVQFVFETCWKPQVCRVEYIQVDEDSDQHRLAKLNTEIAMEDE